MNTAQNFDGLNMPLDGIRLIEASAGTGKTYSLAGLYLRLLVEKNLDVKQILVMTFTRAATRELRERIRQRLCQAAEQAQRPEMQGQLNNEAQFTEALISKAGEPRSSLAQRLREAANRMDEACILTIHGFSQRAAQDNAFNSGLPFDRGDTVDDQEVMQEVVQDYWRQQATGPNSGGFRQLWPEPESLLAQLNIFSQSPHLRIAGLDAAALAQQLSQLKALWQEQAATLQDLLERALSQGVLLASGTGTKGKLKPALQAADGVAAAIHHIDHQLGQDTPCLPAWLALLQDAKNQFHKKAATQAEELQNLALTQQLCTLQPLLKAQALQQAHQATLSMASARKRARRQYSFADMISLLHQAIEGPTGQRLADSLQRNWPWALVDEFQDTDPQQYAILQRCYSGRDHGGMILIGDPKQAIYGFRGGDVHAYLAAAHDAGAQRYGLRKNYRSNPAYLAAVETLFKNPGDDAFLLPGIRFEEVSAGRSDQAVLIVGKQTQPAMNIWQHGECDKAVGKGEAESQCLQACVAQLQLLLDPSHQAYIRRNGQDQAVQPRDIAILVNTNRQASETQQALAAAGIAAVCTHQHSVFSSQQAHELLLLLHAIANPNDEQRLRGALTGELMAYPLARLYTLETDESAWQHELGKFQQAHEIWRQSGILALLQHLLQSAAGTLRQCADADRRLSNYLQLGELLAELEREHFSMSGLLKAFQQRIDRPRYSSEAEQLRLESDEALVRVVTVHKAKGLEYPIVLLPFLPWQGPSNTAHQIPYRYHADAQSMLDFRPAAAMAQQSIVEARAEAMRVLYVALTRAELACYWPWGLFSGCQNSAMASLLHRETLPADQWYANNKTDPLQAQQIQQDLLRITQRSQQSISIQTWPQFDGATSASVKHAQQQTRAREDVPERRPTWQFHSFSSLMRRSQEHLGPALNGAADEDTDLPLNPIEKLNDLPELPGGPVFGDAVHEMLEQLAEKTWGELAEDKPRLQKLSGDTLRQFGIKLGDDPTSAERIIDDTATLLSNTLASEIDGIGRLQDLTQHARKAEMEFHFQMGGSDISSVLKLMQKHGYAQGLQLEEAGLVLRGLMHGYIDLVVEQQQCFFVIDYKTNYLGNAGSDYAPPQLNSAIQHHHYDVQYLIYLTALHRYLKWRLPHYAIDQHLGGARYLFLRGLSPQHPERGVHSNRPPDELILALDRLFACERAA